MGASDKRILPLLDRDTPLLDRVRGSSVDDSVASEMGQLTAELVLEDDDEFIDEQRGIFEDKFRSAIAEELGVEPENIRDEYVDDAISTVTDTALEDILSADSLEELGLSDEDEEDDEDDDASF